VVPVGAGLVGESMGLACREQSQAERGEIRQHVPGIGEQGQGVAATGYVTRGAGAISCQVAEPRARLTTASRSSSSKGFFR
jgi:hypothetical protein